VAPSIDHRASAPPSAKSQLKAYGRLSGTHRVGLQRKGTLSPTRAALERTRAFRRLRNWRVGIEARISHLKRSFGLRRARLRRLGGAKTWVGLGIFACNLQRMTVVATG
jgi:transposase, IS5 family